MRIATASLGLVAAILASACWWTASPTTRESQPTVSQSTPAARPAPVQPTKRQPAIEKPKERPTPGEPVNKVEGFRFYREYGKDQIGFDAKYLGKSVTVEGKIENVEKADDGSYLAVITAPLSPVSNWEPIIICTIHPQHVPDFAKDNLDLRGIAHRNWPTTWKVRGFCRGLKRDSQFRNGYVLVLADCILEPK